MPRRSSRIPVYCLHKASGQAVVRLDGRDHYLGPHDTEESRERYAALIAEWLTHKHSGDHLSVTPDLNLTLNELLAAYLRYADRYYATATTCAGGTPRALSAGCAGTTSDTGWASDDLAC